MRIVIIVLGYAMAGMSLYNMNRQETDAARFTIIMCGIFTILQKLYAGG